MASVTVAQIREYYGVDSTIMSDAEITSLLGFVDIHIGVDVPSSVTTDEKTLLELLQFGCILFRTRNPANYLKKGISAWTVGRISVSFDLSNITSLGTAFCEEYTSLLMKLTSGGSRAYGGVTNTGTGLWQTTQKQGPLFVRVGRGSRY